MSVESDILNRGGRDPGGPPARRRVLLLEDSPEYALLVSQLLAEEFGGEVAVEARVTLDEGLSALAEHSWDCLLLDLGLPDADGLEGLHQVREIAPAVPIVVLTGRDDEALAIEAVQVGAQDYLVKRHAEAHLLARAMRHAIERKRGELEIERQALSDPLTGLANRIVLFDQLGIAIGRARRSGGRLAVLFVDLDRFKLINDTLGHEAGDQVLREIALRLMRAVRPSDTVARFGGDEFVILCDQVVGDAEATRIAERVRAVLGEPFERFERELVLEASTGVAVLDGSATAEDAVRAADRAMFAAKERGIAWQLADAATVTPASSGLDLQAELRAGLERGEFVLDYQPQVDLVTRRVSGVEALLRWRHPKRGLVGPVDFIGEAEDSGLIVPIGAWVVDEACRQLAHWRAEGLCDEDLQMSVNLSPRQLADPELGTVVERAIAEHGLPRELLCLEITERSVIADRGDAGAVLEELRRLGALLALDDFGIGHSSLGVLDQYAIDVLKVDRTFVAKSDRSLRGARMLAAVIGLSRALGLRAIVEGVEAPEQLAIAADAGADAAQGFLLCRPRSAAEVEPVLLTRVGAAAT